jgi:5-deoxy-glucuronate isomerase
VPSLPLDPQKLFFSDTASRLGRHVAVSPANSELEHLHYGRIRLGVASSGVASSDASQADAARRTVSFTTGGRETGLLCMKGRCRIRVRQQGLETGDEDISLDQYDAVYVPRGSAVEVSTDAEVDLVEVAAEVSGQYPLQIIRYAEVAKTPSLKFSAGNDGSRRDLNIVIGSNVQAGRIVAGFTRSAPGNWTSWPPHEHSAILEEAYVYFDMPAPAFGVQLVYSDPERPEFARIVRDGDAVLMPAGYHPNVAAPGHNINFIWMMAARNEVSDRLFGVVNVQPGFGDGGSGLEASQR